MNLSFQTSSRGIALIVVMIAIMVLAILAGGFAYSMKVETKLARNANNETELLWLGRSGVEYARWILAQQLNCGSEPYDSLNQIWAGGSGGGCVTNGPLAEVQREVHLGNGKFTWKITDLERKCNINIANEDMLRQALTLVGVDAGDSPGIIGSILDWIDTDNSTHINGTESDYYESLEPPYFAKNRPIDDLSELLLVRGVTQEIYWGPACTNHTPAAFQPVDRLGRPMDLPTYPVGLVDIFTPLSTGKININTASFTTLQMIPYVDENIAAEIIRLRSGLDGVDGTEDDTPFRNVGELANAGLGNMGGQAFQFFGRFCDVRSKTFEVQIDAEVGGYKRQFFAILGRNNPRDVQTLAFYWK